MNAALAAHLATGLTTACQCWAIRRKDGVSYGFTDHDQPLRFDGITFRADSGMSARALMLGTGLAVDNSEAMGVLSDASLSEAEISAGRFDGAEVRVWQVNWQDVTARQLRFRGTIGEIRRGAGAFHAELRGLTEALNQPQGRVFQRMCSAVLGDKSCQFDLADPSFSTTVAVKTIVQGQVFGFGALSSFAARWFERGRLHLLTGEAAGLSGVVKHDQTNAAGLRVIELWEPVRAEIVPGDLVRIEAGCDKRAETCRFKFDNMLNFRGFPFVPGEDWLVSVPVSQDDNTGGRLPL